MTEYTNDFTPPFCPNPKCEYHKGYPRGLKHWRSRGLATRKNLEEVRRFTCKSCGKCFCSRSFSINYCLKKTGHLSVRIFYGCVHQRSNRSLARELKVSEGLVRTRISKLANQALGFHAKSIADLKISEPIAYDGLECFARSQYEPNNINQAIGSNSLFCYLFNFAPMNRKGKTSKRQKKVLFNLEQKEGRFNPKAIRIASKEMFSQLVQMKDPTIEKLILRTDEHFQYRRAIKKDLKSHVRFQIEHETVSSKAFRNFKNILFAVNHFDMNIRKHLAAYTRETISFSKKASRMVHKYILYMVYKNYMKPCYVKEHKLDNRVHTHSPAMLVGITECLLKFKNMFHQRILISQLDNIPKAWISFSNDSTPFPREHRFLQGNRILRTIKE